MFLAVSGASNKQDDSYDFLAEAQMKDERCSVQKVRCNSWREENLGTIEFCRWDWPPIQVGDGEKRPGRGMKFIMKFQNPIPAGGGRFLPFLPYSWFSGKWAVYLQY